MIFNLIYVIVFNLSEIVKKLLNKIKKYWNRYKKHRILCYDLFLLAPSLVIALLYWTIFFGTDGVHIREVLLYYLNTWKSPYDT